jgi:hypothetical protein
MLIRMSCMMLAMLVLPSMFAPAHTGGIESTSCVARYGAYFCSTIWGRPGDSYIRTVPYPGSARKEAESVQRDRKWMARCRPGIEEDRYGVNRYYYAAPGCEFGVIGVKAPY